MTYEPFSLIIVPFPFTDKPHVKRRPALVLSNTHHQKETDHITLLMVTSDKHSDWKSDYQITDIQTTGLTSPSIIRQKLFTIDNRLVIGRIGHLSNHDTKEVKNILTTHLSLKH